MTTRGASVRRLRSYPTSGIAQLRWRGVRKALLKVQGFDFVPENLRSNSFKRAAQAVLTAHHTFGNFYAEPEPTKQLARMGTSIPGPALAECLRAYLSVFLGNAYSHSWDAASIAERELKKVSRDRWELYLSKIFPAEQDLLFKLNEAKPLKRWTELVAALGLAQYAIAQSSVAKLIEASARQSLTGVTQHATALLRQFRGG